MDNILIVGSYSTFTNELINKFYKEKWNIYTLISNKKRSKPAHVFEQYVFPYDSNSVDDIIRSCRPDVILFTGAYDPLFLWEGESPQAEALKYIAGLSNILMSAAAFGIRHFVYISSEQVFEEEYVADIKEEILVSPNSLRGMTISQGESMAKHFDKTTQMEVTVLRIAGLYGIPTEYGNCTDIYSTMCADAQSSGRLEVNAKKVISALYVRDGVEAVYVLVNAPERKHRLYHVSSKEEVTEEDVARLIQEKYSHPIEIVDLTVGLRHRTILSNARFSGEFPFEVRTSYREMIPVIISHMKRHKNLFLHGAKSGEEETASTRIWEAIKNILPFLESVVFFFPFFFLDRYISANPNFQQVNVYLFYVLLFSIIHGRHQAVFSSLLSVLGYSIGRLQADSGLDLIIDMNTYIWIAQIFIVGLTVGYLKDKFLDMEVESTEQVEFLEDRLKDITAINSSNMKLKNYYAERLISSSESIGRIYNITSMLEKAKLGEVLFAALDTISEIMESPDVSIYLVSNQRYCRLASASSEKARTLGKSLAIRDYPMMFDALSARQVYINRSLNDELPMMGSALFDDSGNMRIVIFLWNIPYEKMTLYQSNLLTVIGALVYSAVVRDADYLDALSYRRFVEGTAILQEEAFEAMLEVYRTAGEKGYAESSLFYINEGAASREELSAQIRVSLRDTDYLGITQDNKLAILLTNTNKNEAAYVRKRLEEKGIDAYMEQKV